MTASSRPPPRVVIVHDGANPQKTVEFLANAGLRVVTLRESDDLFNGIVAGNADIIVLDFDCDGDLTERLKSDPRTKHIPVIALVELVDIKH